MSSIQMPVVRHRARRTPNRKRIFTSRSANVRHVRCATSAEAGLPRVPDHAGAPAAGSAHPVLMRRVVPVLQEAVRHRRARGPWPTQDVRPRRPAVQRVLEHVAVEGALRLDAMPPGQQSARSGEREVRDPRERLQGHARRVRPRTRRGWESGTRWSRSSTGCPPCRRPWSTPRRRSPRRRAPSSRGRRGPASLLQVEVLVAVVAGRRRCPGCPRRGRRRTGRDRVDAVVVPDARNDRTRAGSPGPA